MPAAPPQPDANRHGTSPDPQGASSSEPASEPLPATAEPLLEGVTLDEASVVNSPMLPYVRMVMSLIEGVEFTFREVIHLLGQAMRQHSIGARDGVDYFLGFLHQQPP